MNSKLKSIYCFDTSAFIQLHIANKVIPIPDLWSELSDFFALGKIISHEFVFEEINPKTAKPDFIAKWIENKQKYFFPISDKQIELVSKILGKFPDLIDPEKEKNEADPWLIALALEKMDDLHLFKEETKVIVVSQEKISSSKKIPAACKEFGVQHMNLEEFFKDNNWKFTISKKE